MNTRCEEVHQIITDQCVLPNGHPHDHLVWNDWDEEVRWEEEK